MVSESDWTQFELTNDRGIHRNEREFPDPDVFKPERYLDENRRPFPNAQGYQSFGFGRRQCSGQVLAEQGLSISLTKLLWLFNMKLPDVSHAFF